MSDDYGDEVTPTNQPRLAREARARLRGDLPAAEPGSITEQFGYAPADSGRENMPDFIPPAVRKRDAVLHRQQWLQWRRTGFGASDVSVLYGWGFENQSLYQLWMQKVGLIPAGDTEDTERFEFGRRAEPMLARWFEDESGLYVFHEQERRTHPEHAWCLATIDGEVFEGPSRDGLEPLGGIEIKTASPWEWKPDDPIPIRYAAQAQWQMFVCGWERVWFAVLHGTAFRIYELLRDEADIAELYATAHHFWHGNVLALVPPEIDDSPATAKALGQAYRGDHERTTVNLSDLAGTLMQLREAKAEVTKWKATAELQKNRLKAAMGDATYADFGNGGPEVTWSRFNKRQVDNDLLKQRFPEIYEIVVKPTPSSSFRVSGEKEEAD